MKNQKNSLPIGVSFIQQTSGKKFYLADPAEQWDAINGVGLRNHFLCTVYASRMMVERKNGLIVNVSSPGGLRFVKIWNLKKLFSKAWYFDKPNLSSVFTLPTADILGGKNARAWVSMVSYLKKLMKIKMLKRKRNATYKIHSLVKYHILLETNFY